MGRPRKRLPSGGLDIIRDMAAKGCRETEIARVLGMAYATWRKIRDDDPEVKQVWQEARAIEHDQLVGILHEKALQGDATACMFLLKARHGYRDHGAPEATEGSRVNLTFNLPGPLTQEQYSRLIQVDHDNTKVLNHE